MKGGGLNYKALSIDFDKLLKKTTAKDLDTWLKMDKRRQRKNRLKETAKE